MTYIGTTGGVTFLSNRKRRHLIQGIPINAKKEVSHNVD